MRQEMRQGMDAVKGVCARPATLIIEICTAYAGWLPAIAKKKRGRSLSLISSSARIQDAEYKGRFSVSLSGSFGEPVACGKLVRLDPAPSL